MTRGYDWWALRFQHLNSAMRPAFTLALLAVISLAGPAHAQVYKCKENGSGKITYSDVPCHGGNTGRDVDVRDNTLDTSGSREQALRREVRELQERMDTYESRAGSSQYGRTQADLQAERADSVACERARRSLEIEAGSMTRNKATVASREAAMRSACGLREPDRVEIHNDYRGRTPARVHRPNPGVITHCDAGGCWDRTGGRYNKGAGNGDFPAGGGGACQMIGGRMQCP